MESVNMVLPEKLNRTRQVVLFLKENTKIIINCIS